MTKRTQAEILELKSQWKWDPCWDIEDTEGFEAHYEELKAYRIKMEALWKYEYDYDLAVEINKRMTDLRCTPELAEYTLILERKISGLENRIEQIIYSER